jgi:hypothetical protein
MQLEGDKVDLSREIETLESNRNAKKARLTNLLAEVMMMGSRISTSAH